MSPHGFESLARGMAAATPAPHALFLQLEELLVEARSNSACVIDDLRGYFAPFLASMPEDGPGGGRDADLRVLLLDGPAWTPPVALAVRPHAPGKRPDKERFADLPLTVPGGAQAHGAVGRIARKQATGMVFLYGGRWNIAVGPCAQNRNQLVNFLCARYMERRLAQGFVLGHAAGVCTGDGARALALCGFAGMGKSTLALHLLARGCDFISNDRVLVEPRAAALPLLHGIPKHPRLNPGTALGNPELARLLARALPEAKRSAAAALTPAELYALEDKYDAPIDDCFGACFGGGKPSRFRLFAPLAGLVVLNWAHGGGGGGDGGGGDFCARRVDLADRPELLRALRKDPGVFYLPQALAGARLTGRECLEALRGVPVLELCGGSDFSAGATACLELLG